jgi:hypothetical protein
LWLKQTEVDDEGTEYESGRLILGLEKCALQGIFVDPSVACQFDDKFFHDLAGNAFCAPVILVIVVSILVVLGAKAKQLHGDQHARAEASGAGPYG